jgi:hypothetical protein
MAGRLSLLLPALPMVSAFFFTPFGAWADIVCAVSRYPHDCWSYRRRVMPSRRLCSALDIHLDSCLCNVLLSILHTIIMVIHHYRYQSILHNNDQPQWLYVDTYISRLLATSEKPLIVIFSPVIYDL